jgi:DNA-binding MarR family transcriptional regulator
MNIENGFKIFHAIFSASFFLKKNVKRNMKNFGLSEAEARFMFFIGLGKGKRKIGELIEFSGKHKSTVRQKLKLLEAKRIIEVKSCEKDKRSKIITFTKKGEVLFKKILDFNNNYQKKVFQNLDDKELQTLLGLLGRLNINNKYELENE